MDTSKPSPEFPLPMELLREIIILLPPADRQVLSLTSRLTRSQVVPFIFGHLRYRGKITPKIRNIHRASKEVKDVIKKLELFSRTMSLGEDDDSTVIFQFLESLPNLQVLKYRQHEHLVQPADLSRLRSASLLELVIDTGNYTTVEGLPTAGHAGLENFSISWFVSDNPNEPESSLAHLYELIRPSLVTLVKLRIDNQPEKFGGDFDLQLLKPAGDTLRTFEYTLQSSNESVLDTIPEIFPHLTTLSIRWDNLFTDHSVLWKDSHVEALAKNNNLTDLTLSSDFEESADDTLMSEGDYAWYVRCYKRRLKATQDIALACPLLLRCSWVQMGTDTVNSSMLHPFVIEEQTSGGEVTRVVRGMKQDWMGSDQEDWFTGGIVKCKLEDLPGDIIGHNDE
ncbi:unnamed protein product [Cyclocybe aegerita]|uniref:F-box domain-containing protein n=1 Tax=Cyclocybe aegerita TaxID=1973307 RepID=A0A8S0WZ81_CYCAE|nr:unnamed protein product [Cyclocybe aegerita]